MGSQSDGDPPLALSSHGLGTRYVTIAKTEGSLEDHNIFLVTKSVEAYGSIEKAWSNRRDGSVTFALKEKYAKRVLESMKTLADGTPITIKLDTRLNTSRAVVVCKQLAGIDAKDIETELKDQHVISVRHISKLNADKTRSNTGVVILTFSKPTPPERIRIGYRSCYTETYYPRPMQCYRCYEFQHISKNCKNTERCRVCSKEAHTEEETCSKEYLCINCKGNHSPTNKKCKIYVMEKQIVTAKIDKNISFQAARRLIEKANGKDSYAKITANNAVNVDEIIKNARSQWEKDMENKIKFINEKMEQITKKESEIEKLVNQMKAKESETSANLKKKEQEIIALDTHCDHLTNELQKRDELIKSLKLQVEKQEQKIKHIKEKHGKKIKMDKPHESSPEREINIGTPKRKKHVKNTQSTPHNSDSEVTEIIDAD